MIRKSFTTKSPLLLRKPFSTTLAEVAAPPNENIYASETVAQTMNNIIDANFVKKVEMERCVWELRKYRNSHHALEVIEWIDKCEIDFSNTEFAVGLDLISKVHGVFAAEAYFNNLSPHLQNRNTYGALLNTYCKLKMTDKALTLFKDIEAKNYTTSLAFNNIMTLYIALDQPEKIPPIVEEMKTRKIHLSTFTYNIWMQAYSILGDIEGVERVFEEKTRDEKEAKEACKNWTTYSNLAAAYVKAGLGEKAESALRLLEKEMGRPSRDAYHFLITFYSSLHNQEEVRRLSNVLRSSFETSKMSYRIILQAYGNVNDLDELKKCFEEWESVCLYYDTCMVNVVVSAYLRNVRVEEAEFVFEGAVKQSKLPLVETLVLFMKHYLATEQIDMAYKCLETTTTQCEASHWYLHVDGIEVFMKYFQKKQDVEGAEKLYVILKKLKCVNDKVYGLLLQTYVAAGKTDTNMRHRIERDGISVTPELDEMLNIVCSK